MFVRYLSRYLHTSEKSLLGTVPSSVIAAGLHCLLSGISPTVLTPAAANHVAVSSKLLDGISGLSTSENKNIIKFKMMARKTLSLVLSISRRLFLKNVPFSTYSRNSHQLYHTRSDYDEHPSYSLTY